MIEAVIFDLDDTLLDTSALSVARANGQWAIVKARLDRVEPFAFDGIAIEAIPARLKATGLKIGVLTHSPGWYAAALLDRFEIRPDAIITGSDGYAPKPDPTSLKALADELGVATGECVYVGDLGIDVAAVVGACPGVLSRNGARRARTPRASRPGSSSLRSSTRCQPDPRRRAR